MLDTPMDTNQYSKKTPACGNCTDKAQSGQQPEWLDQDDQNLPAHRVPLSETGPKNTYNQMGPLNDK